MKRLSAHTQPTNLYMCFSLSCPADVEGKCLSFGTNAVSLEGKGRFTEGRLQRVDYFAPMHASVMRDSIIIIIII